MNALHQTFAIQADRSLLGTFALAACLAGGTATQNHAGVPRAIDTAQYAGGWEAGAPRQPDRTIAAMAATLAPSGPAKRVGAIRHLPSPQHEASIAQTRLIVGKRKAAPTANPAARNPAALVAAAATAETSSDRSAIPSADSAVPVGAALPPVELVAIAAPTAVEATAAVKTIDAAPTTIDPAPLKLVNSPEVRRFDLARFSKAPAQTAKLAASRKASAPVSAKARPADRLIDGVVYHHASVEVAGQARGDIAVRIGPDMKPSVKVADLLGLISAQMDPDALARFQLASSANDYVSFAALRSAGFEVKYNAAADSIAISVAP